MDLHTDPHVTTPSRTGRTRGPAPSRRARGRGILSALAATLCVAVVTGMQARGPGSQSGPPNAAPPPEPSLTDAQSHFYNARYQAAADLALALRSADTEDLANDELRSSALLFQLKGLLEPPGEKHTTSQKRDKERALKNCAACPALMAEFFNDITHGQNLARGMLRTNPRDEMALFYLGKLDLNYVWLQLGPLGRKTGWDEYWEARRSLDAVIKDHPRNVRALVARAWIDYIVDTKMPWGTRWLLGGGSRKRALAAVRAAALIESDFYSHTEAEFALWDLQVREGQIAQATEVAHRLAQNFPDNRELAAFLANRESSASR